MAAFRALESIIVRYNSSGVYRRTFGSLYVCRSLLCSSKPSKLIIKHVTLSDSQFCSRGFASKKKREFIISDIMGFNCFTAAKGKGTLKLGSLDENEAVSVEEVKEDMEDVLSRLRQSLAKLSVKITPGK